LRRIFRKVFGATCLTILGLAAFLGSGALPVAAGAGCPNEAIREEQHSTFLPDCRAYEKVSPPDKNGGDVMRFTQQTRAASDGSAVQYASLVGSGEAMGTSISSNFIGVRTGEVGTQGWRVHPITPSLEPLPFLAQLLSSGFDTIYRGEMSADLSHGVIETTSPLTTGSPDTDQVLNLYLRTDIRSPGAGHYELISACPACEEPLSAFPTDRPEFAGASADFSHILFETTQNLTAEATALDASAPKAYEWHDGVVRLAGILPNGDPAPASKPGAGVLVSSTLTAPTGGYAFNAISRDGSRVYFTEPVSGSNLGRIYLRIENGTPGASTVEVNVAEPTPNSSPLDDGRFWAATPDGRYAFFTTKENLLPQDTGNENFTDLYRWDSEAPTGERLTLISQPDLGLDADVGGFVGASDDGRYVYFISSQQLVTGEPSSGGINRIFVWHEGTIHEVSAISPLDVGAVIGGTWRADPKSSRVTGDGTRLAFVSRNTGESQPDDLPHVGSSDACTQGGGCAEVYTYNATTNATPVCISCTTLDTPAKGDSSFLSEAGRGAAGSTSHLNHPLSEQGRYVFFTSPNALVPQDTNEAADAYEYDTETETIHLISSGTSPDGSYFLDASADGSDVFFATRQRLLGWDGDEQVDLYDARLSGGLPEPPPAAATCAGNDCRPAPSSEPLSPDTGSATFKGRGSPRLRRHPKKHHRRHHHRRSAHPRGDVS
jgi:hypothetical protein